jgi:hypothetical protein
MEKRLLLASLVLAGCGANVVVDGSSGTTTTTTTGSTTTGTTFTTTATTTIVTTTTTGTLGCTGGSISVIVDNGPPEQLGSMCNDPMWNPTASSGAIGYLLEGGATNIPTLQLLGCASGAPGAQGIQIHVRNATGKGTYSDASVSYTDGMGTTYTSMTGTTSVAIAALEPVGGVIVGQYKAIVVGGGSSKLLNGGIGLCHVPGELVP